MRNACKSVAQVALSISLFAACAALARAQGRDPRLVSARAGAVNFVVGDVTMRRAGEKSWQSLVKTDDLRSGDTVRTGADGWAEVLLNPGSYLRLGGNSEFELTDNSLDSLRLKIVRGSAVVEASIPEYGAPRVVASTAATPQGSIIEASARDAKGFVILIDTPQAQMLVVRGGLYRVNVAASGATEVVVRDGRALVGRDAVLVKGGKVALVASGGAVEIAKLDGKQKDDLDVWSKQRAQELARVNNQLAVRTLNAAFTRMTWDNFGWGYNPTGLWYWEARFNSYTYIPFYSCHSPYGYGYGTIAPGLLNTCDCYRGFDYRPGLPYILAQQRGNGGGGSTNGGGGSTGSGGGSVGTGGGGMIGGGGSILGGSGNGGTMTRPPAEAPAPTVQNSGSGNSRRMDPPR